MPQPIQIAEIDLIDARGRKNGSLSITSAIKSEKKRDEDIFEASSDEMEIWGEERVQLLENGRYEFKIMHSGPLQIRELGGIITNYKLEKHTGLIEPGSNVGLLTLELEDENTNIQYAIPLEVRSLKLEYREHYRQMLDEIAEECSGLLMQVKSPVKGFFKSNLDEPAELIAQKYSFVKHLIASDEFKNAIARIITSPHIKLDSKEERIDIRKGFKPTHQAIRQLSHRTHRSAVSTSHPIHKLMPTVPTHINILNHKEAIDTEENKFVKHVISSFLQLLWNMEKSLQRKKKLSPSDTRLMRDIVSSKKALAKVLSHDLFVGLSELKTLNLGSPVLQRKPGYREILSTWIRFNASSGLIWSGGLDVFGGGKKDVDSLYEYWVFFKLLKIVINVFKLAPINKEDLFEITEDGFSLKLKAGKCLLINGVCHLNGRSLNVKFAYNRVFNRKTGAQPHSNYPEAGTWTKIMRPDYTISVWPTEVPEDQAEYQELMAHIHFDAKYKFDSSNNVFDLFGADQEENLDMEKRAIKSGLTMKRTDLFTLHTYKDAIRRTEGAYIIYPGNTNESWRQYHEILPGIGAFAVRPEKLDPGTGNLESFLNDVLVHLTNRVSQRELFRFNITNTFTSRTSEAYAEVPELEAGNRTVPFKDHYLLIAESDDGTYYWVKERLIFIMPLDEGEVNANLFAAKHIFLKSTSGQFVLLKIVGKPHFLMGANLLNSSFPNLIPQKSYIRYTVIEDKAYIGILEKLVQVVSKASIGVLSLADILGNPSCEK